MDQNSMLSGEIFRLFMKVKRLETEEGELLAGITLSEPATRLAFDPFGYLWLLDNEYTLSVRRYEVREPSWR